MGRVTAIYYRGADGSEPVAEFVADLDVRRQVVIDNQIDRLNDLDEASPPLPFPHSSQIEGELRELRCHFGSELYRILYRRSDNLIVLLHAFRKKTGKVPQREVDLAKARWVDFKARMNAVPRKPPRAVGRDAP